MKTISLFSGAGGLDIGATMAGAKIVCSIDTDQDSIETLKLNNKNSSASFLNEDVSILSGKEILDRCGQKKKDIQLLIGGPPCQSFSKNNYWTKSGDESLRRKKQRALASSGSTQSIEKIKLSKATNRVEVDNDKRTTLVMEYARLISEISPTGFLFENVLSITHPKNKKFLDEFVSFTEKLGYKVRVFRLSSEAFGVPQIRKRVFVVGHKKRLINEPTITHSVEESLFLDPPVTAKMAIGKFRSKKFYEEGEIMSGKWSQYLPDIPPGMNYKALTAWAGYENPIFEAETRFWNFLLKLDPNRPSWTIPANPGPWIGPLHWENRRLRTVEMAALQSFPAEYEFHGSRRSKIKQIGNAVPPLMAKAVVKLLTRS